MSFGIRGSVATTLFIFLLYNLSPDPITRNIMLFGPQVQVHLPKFIALLIIAIMLGFSSEENRKAEQRAYERMSKIVTLNEIKNSLKLDYELGSILKVTTNSILKIMNCNAALGILYDNMTGEILEKYEQDFDLNSLNKAVIRATQDSELFGPKDKIISSPDSKKIRNILKINLHIDNEQYLIIYLSKMYEKNTFNVSDIELLKTIKVYLELLFKNRTLYKRIESIKDYLYFTFKNLPLGIMILDNDLKIKFINTQALLLLKYDNEKDLTDRILGEDIYIFPDKKIQSKIENEEYMFFHRTQLVAKNLEVKQIELTTVKLKTEYGLIKGMIVSFNDITEMKQMEEELNRRDRLSSLGEMAAGLAHEIRNPLGSIEGFASLLVKDYADSADNEKSRIASKIVEGVNDLNKIVTEFLNFTNKIQLKKQNKNIIETIEKSLLYARKSIDENKIKVEKQYCAQKIIVNYDEDKISRVLLNVILNAVDALSDISEPLISISVRIKENNMASMESTLCCIDFFNNGGNIDENVKSKIFNPFFTTKSNGIGLGLTISQKIIEEHNGRINFKNERNGVKFTIELPVDKRFVYKS
ncbi:GHKL domain-containing protein [Candidatus Dependentiae bacterium]|nr:GHKL domain-containing protein [Candidatus Dependentiae bacterium]